MSLFAKIKMVPHGDYEFSCQIAGVQILLRLFTRGVTLVKPFNHLCCEPLICKMDSNTDFITFTWTFHEPRHVRALKLLPGTQFMLSKPWVSLLTPTQPVTLVWGIILFKEVLLNFYLSVLMCSVYSFQSWHLHIIMKLSG